MLFRRSTPEEKSRIITCSDGFEINPLKESTLPTKVIPWSSIVEAIAFKIDLFSYDRVCLLFLLDDSSEITIHEEMAGWSELIEALPTHLPGTPELKDWFMEITTPAFQSNPVCLYHRSNH